MADQKECFIIMPITTPKSMSEEYRDGGDHFKHVLDCLFIPAIEKAGYKPKPPLAKGSDLIHANIISSLETADIVLCDMSCLNPNVFFEFGIRTSLNKPVCVVKDEITKNVPFDTGILNYQEYKSALDPWHLDADINKLSEHITASYERSKGENTLWKYFGLKTEAAPYKGETGTDGKLDYLALQIDSLQQKVDEINMRSEVRSAETNWIPVKREKSLHEMIVSDLNENMPKGAFITRISSGKDKVVLVDYKGILTEKDQVFLTGLIEHLYNKELKLRAIDASSN